ncbi:hypothetical protein H4R18_000233 [Coemansia javaensis]|uniref:RED-like N-terminal domain-containing protein n=1 Tax=Coemansia javaensis TaxID=2761396 RepID=A0A9W8LMC7_9FUNG|nr:hypothetical protein H4R18_000233 [Coemansia javaensis]
MSDDRGLSQDDFRRMLQTPRAVAGSRAALGGRKRPHAPSRPAKRAPQSPGEASAGEHKRYRDRAAERRREAAGGVPSGASGGDPAMMAAAAAAIGMSEEKRTQYEHSKYLGGSVERTHLVKGLDYLLLEKTRAQLGPEDELDDELERLQAERARASPRAEASGEATTELGGRVAAVLREIEAGRERVRKTMDQPAMHVEFKGELLQPGRMCFELAPAVLLETAAPTVRIRSQDTHAGAAVPGDAQGGDSDALVLARVIGAIERKRTAGAQALSSAKGDAVPTPTPDAPQQPPSATPSPPAPQARAEPADYDEDDDIFADAGVDYTVTVADRQPSPDESEPAPGPASDDGRGLESFPAVAPYPDDLGSDEAVVAPYPDSPASDEMVTAPYPESPGGETR